MIPFLSRHHKQSQTRPTDQVYNELFTEKFSVALGIYLPRPSLTDWSISNTLSCLCFSLLYGSQAEYQYTAYQIMSSYCLEREK